MSLVSHWSSYYWSCCVTFTYLENLLVSNGSISDL